MTIPRPEHPRPNFQRAEWINLNGTWTYTFDFGKSGVERQLFKSEGFKDEILVPFCPESELSGVGHKDFIEMMWYHRVIEIPKRWTQNILLHFGAVDYECEVFIDGASIGGHCGGGSSFDFDITEFTKPGGKHHLVVKVVDDLRSFTQTGGKQSTVFESIGCHYTRTTGIWQTVWLEHVSPYSLKTCRITPDFDEDSVEFSPEFRTVNHKHRLKISVYSQGKSVESRIVAVANGATHKIKLKNPVSWHPDNPFLYDLKLEVLSPDGTILDNVSSYAGIRKIHIEGNRIFLNNAPFYQRLVLDQGFYPNGIWTAPSDEALKNDILLSQKAGFNGARLHQKVFEERFHYWADKLGYLTWGESASWNLNFSTGVNTDYYRSMVNFSEEWREVILRDRNHPSIITWTPFNETCHNNPTTNWKLHRRFLQSIYDLTKSLDPTRPINDASGYVHEKTDLYTIHAYDQAPNKLSDRLRVDEQGKLLNDKPNNDGVRNSNEPLILDEFGGIKWIPEERRSQTQVSWGYGEAPKSLDEFYERLEAQVDVVVRKNPHIRGFCYTQLTDVEQETNGIYNYDRAEKFDMDKIHEIFTMI